MSGEDVKGLNPVYVILFCLGLVLGGWVLAVSLNVETESKSPYDSAQPVSSSDLEQCLSSKSSLIGGMRDSRFEDLCQGKSFQAYAFVKTCNGNKCELSLNDPLGEKASDHSIFDAHIVDGETLSDEKSPIKGLINGRGWNNRALVSIYQQEPAALTQSDLRSRERVIGRAAIERDYQAMLRDSRSDENAAMMEYADENHARLAAMSHEFKINPNGAAGLAQYSYRLKNGKRTTCWRGFRGNVFVYECEEF